MNKLIKNELKGIITACKLDRYNLPDFHDQDTLRMIDDRMSELYAENHKLKEMLKQLSRADEKSKNIRGSGL